MLIMSYDGNEFKIKQNDVIKICVWSPNFGRNVLCLKLKSEN